MTSPTNSELRNLAPFFLGVIAGLFAVGVALYLGFLLTTSPKISVADYIQLVLLLFVVCTLLWSIHIQKEKEKLDESQIYLLKSIELIDKAYNILYSDNKLSCERVAWVTAARLLTRALNLSASITLESHKHIFESEHDFQRHRFKRILKINSGSLPLEFFFGTGHILGAIGQSAYNTIAMSGVEWIPVQAATVIYKFCAFPENYEDPLESAPLLTKNERDRLWLFGDHGFYDYIVFRHYFTSIGAKVLGKRGPYKQMYLTASNLDSIVPGMSGLDIDGDDD